MLQENEIYYYHVKLRVSTSTIWDIHNISWLNFNRYNFTFGKFIFASYLNELKWYIFEVYIS